MTHDQNGLPNAPYNYFLFPFSFLLKCPNVQLFIHFPSPRCFCPRNHEKTQAELDNIRDVIEHAHGQSWVVQKGTSCKKTVSKFDLIHIQSTPRSFDSLVTLLIFKNTPPFCPTSVCVHPHPLGNHNFPMFFLVPVALHLFSPLCSHYSNPQTLGGGGSARHRAPGR